MFRKLATAFAMAAAMALGSPSDSPAQQQQEPDRFTETGIRGTSTMTCLKGGGRVDLDLFYAMSTTDIDRIARETNTPREQVKSEYSRRIGVLLDQHADRFFAGHNLTSMLHRAPDMRAFFRDAVQDIEKETGMTIRIDMKDSSYRLRLRC